MAIGHALYWGKACECQKIGYRIHSDVKVEKDVLGGFSYHFPGLIKFIG